MVIPCFLFSLHSSGSQLPPHRIHPPPPTCRRPPARTTRSPHRPHLGSPQIFFASEKPCDSVLQANAAAVLGISKRSQESRAIGKAFPKPSEDFRGSGFRVSPPKPPHQQVYPVQLALLAKSFPGTQARVKPLASTCMQCWEFGDSPVTSRTHRESMDFLST